MNQAPHIPHGPVAAGPIFTGCRPTVLVTILVASVVFLLLSACAQSYRWQNPNRARDLWDPDQLECNRIASRQIDRELARDQIAAGGPLYGSARTLKSQFAKYDARKRRQVLFNDCMREWGYQREKKSG